MRKRKSKKPIARKDTTYKAKGQAKKKVAKQTTTKAPPKEGNYQGYYYESYQELYTLMWLVELKKNHYITHIQRGTSFLLSDTVMNNYALQLKRGSKPMAQTLLRGHSYTDDYIITPTEKGIAKLFWVLGSNTKYEKGQLVCHKNEDNSYFCRIEVKPRHNYANGDSLGMAVNNIKWVMQNYGIFINIFIPDERFEQTFCPSEYRVTFAGNKRNFKYKPRTIYEYFK